ncbi:hypothetical protein VCHENC02_0111B, partial [Vibrio harveyi]
ISRAITSRIGVRLISLCG